MTLKNKRILVTGVSREGGIGTEITKNLAMNGAEVLITGFSDYDKELQYSDTNPSFTKKLAIQLQDQGYHVHALKDYDLSKAEQGKCLIEEAKTLDGIVINHAYSKNQGLSQWTQETIDQHMQTNVSGIMMLIKAFAEQVPSGRRAAITLFTSGQYKGMMLDEIAYAVSKHALICIAEQSAAALAPQNIQVNIINPGPTDTGWATDPALYESVKEQFPLKRWGMPSDVAKLVHFLQSDDSQWITGQTIASEGWL